MVYSPRMGMRKISFDANVLTIVGFFHTCAISQFWYFTFSITKCTPLMEHFHQRHYFSNMNVVVVVAYYSTQQFCFSPPNRFIFKTNGFKQGSLHTYKVPNQADFCFGLY